MISVLKMIEQAIGEENISSAEPCGRYGVTVQTKSGEQQSYFFTTPIFNGSKAVDMRFAQNEAGFSFQGSNGKITVMPYGLLLKNKACHIRLCWEKDQHFLLSEDSGSLHSEDMVIYPTLNGVCVTQSYSDPLYFTFEARSKNKGRARMNSKCFAYMRAKFKPFVTLNAMYAARGEDNGLIGAELAMKQDSDTQFRFRMRATASKATSLTWELNLYEPKLMQDTTVESRRPKENNAYGDVAFLGHSPDHGVQYLYSRFDLSRIQTDPTKRMKRFLLHIPYYMAGEQTFRVSAPFRRFCSFGSNWANKMPSNDFGVKYHRENGCFVFDLSQYLLDKNGKFKENTGVVFCPKGSGGVSVLATADNYSSPQMIEIQYEKE